MNGNLQTRRTVRAYRARRTAQVVRTGRTNAPVASIIWSCMKTSVTRPAPSTHTRHKITIALLVIPRARLATEPPRTNASPVDPDCFLSTVRVYMYIYIRTTLILKNDTGAQPIT